MALHCEVLYGSSPITFSALPGALLVLLGLFGTDLVLFLQCLAFGSHLRGILGFDREIAIESLLGLAMLLECLLQFLNGRSHSFRIEALLINEKLGQGFGLTGLPFELFFTGSLIQDFVMEKKMTCLNVGRDGFVVVIVIFLVLLGVVFSWSPPASAELSSSFSWAFCLARISSGIQESGMPYFVRSKVAKIFSMLPCSRSNFKAVLGPTPRMESQ